MRRLQLLIALVAALVAGAGAGSFKGGSYGQASFDVAGATYQAGGVATVDTVRIWSRVTAFPNIAGAVTAGHIVPRDTIGAVINQGNAGQSVRWGYVRKDAPTTVYYDAGGGDYFIATSYAHGEDDFTWNGATRLCFVWFSTSGLTNGDKIEKAEIAFNTYSWGGFTINAGAYVAARLDTISQDYRMLNGTVGDYGSGDVARFDMSWDEIDATGNALWIPDLDDRQDFHDFGPRSNTVIGPSVVAAKTSLSLDVTDAVQQASDNGTLGRGLIFVIYGTSTISAMPSFGAGVLAANMGAGANGCKGAPTFTATATSRRGARVWNGAARVPIAVIFDDQYPVQSSYFTAMEAGGKQFDIAAFRTAMTNYSWVDSLYTLKPNLFGLVHHSRTHASLGTLTAAQIHPELARGWLLDEFTGFTAADTLGVVDSAWPAGGSTPNTGVLAASMMIDYGYRSARGYGTGWTATNLGLEYETWPSWSGWFNAYNYRAIGISNLTGAASMADKIGDYVDLAYTAHAKSALVFYGHRNTTAPADGITPAKLTEMIGIADALNSCEILTLEEIMDLRMVGATFGTPQAASYGARLVATTDSVTIRKTAAVMDSLYRADADPNLLEMWIAPK